MKHLLLHGEPEAKSFVDTACCMCTLRRIVAEYDREGAVSKRLALKEKGAPPTLERKRSR